MEWSTDPVTRTGQPFGKWAEYLAAAFVQLEPRKTSDHPFQGTIAKKDIPSIQMSRVEATRHSVLRLQSHIARSHEDVCFVNLQLDGVGCYTQRGHKQICGPGDIAVVDTTEPFEIANCRDFKLYCFALPRHLLPDHFLERPRLQLSATEAGRALSRTIAGYAELCFCAPVSSTVFDFSGAHIADLIAGAPDLLADQPAERVRSPVLLAMMLNHIDRHIDDPRLDAATLAAKFHCSQRYVHKLFSRHDRSVNDHVNHQRIIRCARDLADPTLGNKTIAEIAFNVGFRDISHFNRVFKRSFGSSPRELRRAMLAGAEVVVRKNPT